MWVWLVWMCLYSLLHMQSLINLCLQWEWSWYSDGQYKYLYWHISKPMQKSPKIKGLYPDTWRMWCLSSGINNVLSHVSLVSTLDITVKMACTVSTPDSHELQCNTQAHFSYYMWLVQGAAFMGSYKQWESIVPITKIGLLKQHSRNNTC